MLQFGIPERLKKVVAKKFESNKDLLFQVIYEQKVKEENKNE